jgi:carbon monoxide dehydrogenase subunit G
MASVRKELWTAARPDAVWAAVADVGALHRRLVPGFVLNTVLDGDVRTVTFANGATVREPIVTIDANTWRLVWSSEGGSTTHYNASVQAFAEDNGTRVVWIADFLPNEAAGRIEAAMRAGVAAMQKALDALV